MKSPFERGWSAPSFYLEIGQNSLKAFDGQTGLELPLARLPNGHFTSSCKEQLISSLQSYFKKSSWHPRARVLCAINARGVSLRRLALPASTTENLQHLLALQIESEFPLPPEELAWGYCALGAVAQPVNGSPSQQEFLVAAAKREVVEEYAEILSACGVTGVFTLAALARSCLCPPTVQVGAVLDIGRSHSELLFFQGGLPTSVRILPWGGETLTRALQQQLGIGHEEAEELKLKTDPLESEVLVPKIDAALHSALHDLAQALDGQLAGGTIYITGKSARHRAVVPGLSKLLVPGTRCELLEPMPKPGSSAAILGLKRAHENGASAPLVMLQAKPTNGHATIAQPVPWKWVKLAAALALALLALPYLEAALLKPILARKLVRVKADAGRLGLIDREWNFLQYLKQNQPPYLDALFVMAKAAPQGMKIDSLSLNRRGELSLRGSLRDSQQVTDFRSKLIDSGLFSSVSVEEQVPTPDRQKLNLRMSAQWKPLSARQMLALGPTVEEIEKAKTRKRDPQPGGPMMPPGMGGFPGPMGGPPPGVMLMGAGSANGGGRPMPSPGAMRSGPPAGPGTPIPGPARPLPEPTNAGGAPPPMPQPPR